MLRTFLQHGSVLHQKFRINRFAIIDASSGHGFYLDHLRSNGMKRIGSTVDILVQAFSPPVFLSIKQVSQITGQAERATAP